MFLAFAGQSAFGTGFDFVLSNVQFSGTNSTGAFVTFDVTASHDVEGMLTTTCSPESGSFLPVGESVVSCSATDLEGNTATAEFTIMVLTTDTTPPTVTASPPGGTYSSQQSVTLSADEPATIYYTTDGSTPTTSSPVYSSPIPISSTRTLQFFAQDFAGITGSVVTESYVIIQEFPVIHMSDTTATFGLNLFSSRQAHAELVTPSSQLVGDRIDRMTLSLKRVGSPTGMAEVGIFNPDLSVKKLFGTVDAASLATSYVDLTFALPSELYDIEAGDRIGIKYAGGDSSNLIAVMTDQDPADPFDGTNSYHQYYTTQWISFTNGDMYMVLTQTHDGVDTTPPTVTASPPGGTYSSQQS
ncbi:chitobiase/beta-hexosaminidase C-terminal domain-containing protein, partial [Nitrososphaera sp.]|uniref:chitobiase/beta-hexosaminidase C-terminal domain-containing protein n=1 Tax=Nitrososphaera sp. TaxID=1971748 RepID=UPI0017F44058